MSEAKRVFVEGHSWELVRFDHEQEPRIRDLDLAEELGFEHPHRIRSLIQRIAPKLAELGVLTTVVKTSGAKGGRPGTEYWLNRKQALLVAVKSETPKALDMQVVIVRVFDAAIQGQLPPAQGLQLTKAEFVSIIDDVRRELRDEIHNARLGVVEAKAAKTIKDRIKRSTAQAMSLGRYATRAKAAFAINKRIRDACSFPLADGGWEHLESRLYAKAIRALDVLDRELNRHAEAAVAKAREAALLEPENQVVFLFPESRNKSS